MAKSKHMIHSLGSSMSFGLLSLKAKVLWPMLIAEADDQGRHDVRPQIIKWGVCQNVDEITTEDIPGLLNEMAEQGMLLLYGDGNAYGQIVNWWIHQPMSYARPSEYPAPKGWTDRIRYRKGDDTIKVNWEHPGGFANATSNPNSRVGGNDTPNDTPMDAPNDGSYLAPKQTEDKSTETIVIEDNATATKSAVAAVEYPPRYKINLLKELGVVEPALSELANDPWVMPEHIVAWYEYAHGRPGIRDPKAYTIAQLKKHAEPPGLNYDRD